MATKPKPALPPPSIDTLARRVAEQFDNPALLDPIKAAITHAVLIHNSAWLASLTRNLLDAGCTYEQRASVYGAQERDMQLLR